MLFSPDQLLTEYLVAYARERTLCGCGLKAVERTVVNGPHRGRQCHFCLHPRGDARSCGYVAVFPECPCGPTARVKTAATNGRNYYTCGHQSRVCDWWGGYAPEGVQPSAYHSPRKRSYGGGPSCEGGGSYGFW